MNKQFIYFYLFFSVFTVFSAHVIVEAEPSSLAEPVFKQLDEQGTPIYSNKKKLGGAEVELPVINRAENKLIVETKNNCNGHKGVNCSLGADFDGSVICGDFYKDSEERFSFMCKYAQLILADVLEAKAEGGQNIYIRNTKPVKAINPTVKYTSDLGHLAILSGPKSIEPFTTGEFLLKNEDAVVIGKKLDRTRFEINCDNCGYATKDTGKQSGSELNKMLQIK